MPPRRSFSFFNAILYAIALLGGAGGMYLWLYSILFAPIRPGLHDQVSFEVTKGWDFTTIAKKLEEKELIQHWWSFYFLGQILAKDRMGAIRWGEYHLSQGDSPQEILRELIDGKVVYHEMTLLPGATIKDIARLMADTTLTNEREALAALNDRALLVKLQVPAASFEGYLYPETYKFTRPQNVEHMVSTLVTEGQKQISDEMKRRADVIQSAFEMNWHKIMTLASIIEKETGNSEERRTIASVFYNRLRIGMPLQSDPTVIYGIPNFDGNLTKEDLSLPSLYNTYVNIGLPPTPICSPSLESIQAALYPEDTDYLYFVSKNDGTSHFSSTYKEHQEAVRRYQSPNKAAASPVVTTTTLPPAIPAELEELMGEDLGRDTSPAPETPPPAKAAEGEGEKAAEEKKPKPKVKFEKPTQISPPL